MMAVIPTSEQVTLSYGRGLIDYFGILLTLTGLGLLVVLRRFDHGLDTVLRRYGPDGAGLSPDADPVTVPPVAAASASSLEDPAVAVPVSAPPVVDAGPAAPADDGPEEAPEALGDPPKDPAVDGSQSS
jgi:hypothetical protein